eukprot:2833544-Pleurochrysis_carterae.AAC.1
MPSAYNSTLQWPASSATLVMHDNWAEIEQIFYDTVDQVDTSLYVSVHGGVSDIMHDFVEVEAGENDAVARGRAKGRQQP